MTDIKATGRTRIDSIDILRGIVMVIMALDHSRDFFQRIVITDGSGIATNPTNMATTTPILFFTRWITHFCAPIFVFLAGTAIWMMSQKKTRSELSLFLIKRGFWLIFVDAIIITFAWTFNPQFNVIIFQVIWALGVSMLIMGLLIYLPFRVMVLIGLIIVFGHNLLDYPSINKNVKEGFLADILYFAKFPIYPIAKGHVLLIVYAFLPWTGVMILGYGFGKIFTTFSDQAKRRKMLLQMGAGLLVLFIALRLANHYGDPFPWFVQERGSIYTFLSFLNVNKYPPSLDFLSLTIGVGMIMLSILDGVRNRVTDFFRIYGRVPMFYYILHFYVLHTLVVIVFYAEGFSGDQIVSPNNPFLFRPPGSGFTLAGVYAVWIFVVLILYPLCRKYDRYKSTNRDWWLNYV